MIFQTCMSRHDPLAGHRSDRGSSWFCSLQPCVRRKIVALLLSSLCLRLDEELWDLYRVMRWLCR